MEAGEGSDGNRFFYSLADEALVHRDILYKLHMESFLGQSATRQL